MILIRVKGKKVQNQKFYIYSKIDKRKSEI